MRFYSLNLDKIKDVQAPDPGDLLARDGSNLASVFKQLSPSAKERIKEYLATVVPSVDKIEARKYGPKEGLVFTQTIAQVEGPQRFLANSMSDGTLRALGILVALFQGNNSPKKRVLLVGIEEPEGALHPAAAGVLLDALREAADQDADHYHQPQSRPP